MRINPTKTNNRSSDNEELHQPLLYEGSSRANQHGIRLLKMCWFGD